jgi:hypothetical protein
LSNTTEAQKCSSENSVDSNLNVSIITNQ